MKDVKLETRLKRKRRIRKKIFGTAERPRVSVFRSAKHIYLQAIDDGAGNTLACASSLEQTFKGKMQTKPEDVSNKVFAAELIGKILAERLLEKGIKQIVFDRNGYLYHGRVKAVTKGARDSGLDF